MRRAILWSGCAMLLAASCAEPADPRPNVVLIVVDTLRWDYLPEYGYPLPTSGAMAPFFAEAIRFERAYAASSWTKPSVATILSGLLPARHGAGDVEGKRLAAAIELLPEVLSRHGWDTAGFSHNINVSVQTGFDPGFAHFSADESEGPTYRDVQEMVDEVRAWLPRRGGRPFFLYLQPMNVHGPYWVPPERQRDLLGRDPGRDFAYFGPLHRAVMEKGGKHRDLVTPAMIQGLRERYAVAVRYTMDRLAEVLDELRRRGLYESSLIVLTADHGEELFDHGGFSHGHTLYEEVVRVPLFLKLPGVRRSHSVVTEPFSLVDLYPTLLAALGVAPPAGLDGRSRHAELTSEAPPEAHGREIYFQVRLPKRCVARGLLAGDEKLIEIEADYEGRSNSTLLFDLAADPGERLDLAPVRREIAGRLAARLASAFTQLHARALDLRGEPEAEVDPAALRALGYL